jgi:transposase
MSNVLPVSEQATIESLYKKGWSLRRIAGELGLNRRTVKRYAAKCTREVTPGSEGGERGEDSRRPSKARSRCAEFVEVIAGKVEVGCSAQRIWQDLVEAHGFTSSYQSVKRFVRRWRKKQPARRKKRGHKKKGGQDLNRESSPVYCWKEVCPGNYGWSMRERSTT